MGKLTISMAMFNSFLYVYQRVSQTLSQWLLTPRYDSQWSTSWDDPPSGPYVVHVVHVGIKPWMLWCRHCKGQHALFPGQHWRGGLAVAAKKPPAGCFSPWKPWIFESKSISWINLWFCEVKYHFFWGGDMSCFWKVWCSGWNYVRKLCFMAKCLSTPALRWRTGGSPCWSLWGDSLMNVPWTIDDRSCSR